MPVNSSLWLANVVLILHVLFVLFVVLGQLAILLGWWRRWQWTRGFVWRCAHLAAIVFVTLETWIGVVCPLTWLEDALRRGAGEAAYRDGFIADALRYLLYYEAPAWMFIAVYSAFAALTLASFVFHAPQRNSRWNTGSNQAE